MNEFYQLAALVNELGLDKTAKLLKLSKALIKKALETPKRLTKSEKEEIKNVLEIVFEIIENDDEEEYPFDEEDIEIRAEQLEEILDQIKDDAEDLREAVKEEFIYGQITPELLDIAYDFFNNISIGQQIKLSEWLNEDVGEFRQVAFFLDKVKSDIDNGVELYDHVIGEIESDFWQWFRETFYNG